MGFFKDLFGGKKQPEQVAKADLAKYTSVAWMTERRLKSITRCIDEGFDVAPSLPTALNRSLRPTVEIAQRLSAIKAIVLWLMVPQDVLPNDPIHKYIEANKLLDFLTNDERQVLSVARDDQNARNQIGWKFENAWPLAWFFGYHEPPIEGQMMSGDQMQEILQRFSCPLNESIDNWVLGKETKSGEQVEVLEDLFYCVHNAVRSAQIGAATVPAGFDPVANGGVIHERRHALTWMLSSDTVWENTDLST